LKVLVLAVLVIVITAPIGAVAIFLSGPRLLKHCPPTYNYVVDQPKAAEENGKAEETGKEDSSADEKLLDTHV
jgi:hypothetical protein